MHKYTYIYIYIKSEHPQPNNYNIAHMPHYWNRYEQCRLSFICVFFKYHYNDGAVSFPSSQSNVCSHTYEQNRYIRRPVDRLIAHDPGYYQLIILTQHDEMDMG